MNNRGRSTADPRLAAELLAGSTVADAADAAGISERTVYRRLNDPEFQGRLSEARAEFAEHVSDRLAEAASAAVDALVGMLGDASATVRLAAAKTILELGPKARSRAKKERAIATEEAKRNPKPQMLMGSEVDADF